MTLKIPIPHSEASIEVVVNMNSYEIGQGDLEPHHAGIEKQAQARVAARADHLELGKELLGRELMTYSSIWMC